MAKIKVSKNLLLPYLFAMVFCMGNRALKRRVTSLRARISEHEKKIMLEKQSACPDFGLITHWQVEIEAFRSGLERALKRIG